MILTTLGKKPHVHGKLSEFISEFIEGTSEATCGYEKSWIMRKEPGVEGFSVTPRGEARKCPIREMRLGTEKGPEYLPSATSLAI
jgi:hypothetical protein